jgi:preprotein translocase subunit YajC
VLAIVWMLLVVVAFYFLIVRPQRRRMMEMRVLQSSLQVGDEVVTTAGIFGVVQDLDPETVRLEIAPGTTIRLARGAVSQRLGVDDATDVTDVTDEPEPGDGPLPGGTD